MRSVHTDRSTHFHSRGWVSPACIAVIRHWRGDSFIGRRHGTSTFLHPLAPSALPDFHAAMGALTPARPTLNTRSEGIESRPFTGQVFLVHTVSVLLFLSYTPDHCRDLAMNSDTSSSDLTITSATSGDIIFAKASVFILAIKTFPSDVL